MADKYITIAGTSYRYKKTSGSGGGGGGGGSDTPSTDVSGGTLYAGTYFLRKEPNMNLAPDDRWNTFDDMLNAIAGTYTIEDLYGNRFVICGDGNNILDGYNNIKPYSFGLGYYFEHPYNSSDSPTLMPKLHQIDHFRVFTSSTNVNINNKILFGSYETADAGQGFVWSNIGEPHQSASGFSTACTENIYPNGESTIYGSGPDDSSIWNVSGLGEVGQGNGLKLRTLVIPRTVDTHLFTTNEALDGDFTKMWKTIAKLAPSKGDIINLPFAATSDDLVSYPCRILELNGTIAKVVRLTPIYDLNINRDATGTYNNGGTGYVYQGSGLQTAVNNFKSNIMDEGFLAALVGHSFDQFLYSTDTESS